MGRPYDGGGRISGAVPEPARPGSARESGRAPPTMRRGGRRSEGEGVKFGLRYANIGPLSRRESSLELARFAEDAGFESIWTIEHVVIPMDYRSAYPYSEDGRF